LQPTPNTQGNEERRSGMSKIFLRSAGVFLSAAFLVLVPVSALSTVKGLLYKPVERQNFTAYRFHAYMDRLYRELSTRFDFSICSIVDIKFKILFSFV